MKAALLVIDMQNDFILPGGVLEVKGIRAGLKKLNEFIADLRKKKVPVIYTRHCFSKKNNPVEARLFPNATNKLKKNSPGWQIHKLLTPKDDIIIDKTRYDAFFKTKLDKVLQRMKVDTLIITGTMTNICCESTARSAMYRDHNVIFCSDLTFCSGAAVQKNTLNTIRSHFGKVMTSQQILKLCKQL